MKIIYYRANNSKITLYLEELSELMEWTEIDHSPLDEPKDVIVEYLTIEGYRVENYIISHANKSESFG
jgi:hypothetical protein